jgi:alpha-glucosidase
MEENVESTPSSIEEVVSVTPPDIIPFSETDVSFRYEDVYEDRIPNEVVSVRWTAGAYEFQCQNGVALRVQFPKQSIARLRYSPDGTWERDFSYALDLSFRPERHTVRLSESEQEYTLSTDTLQLVVQKNNLKIRVFNQDDGLIYEDGTGYQARRTIMKGWNKVLLNRSCHKKTHFYGLGDKAVLGANLAGRNWSNWCTDSYAFGTGSDHLYRAIPFVYVLQQGMAHGVFFDNTYKTHFDFEQSGGGTYDLWAEGGELNYYFIYGPRLTEVANQYLQLTGTHAMPPHWALGYHQCRWSYYPDAQVKALANLFRRQQIPCDAIYLDIDYMDGYRCFTWDERHFPDPKKMRMELEEMGFRLVTMIDPGIKEDSKYEVYREGLEKGYFVKTADGQVAKAPVWPGFSAFPDFTNPEVRTWWGNWYRDMYERIGISGFWNDMNEPAVFYVHHKTLPDTVLHQYDGDPCSHRKAHNIYGMQMNRASYEGMEQIHPEKRPFLLTRATYSGGQRFAAVWTGDNCASWEHLQIANLQCQRLSISGFSFCGTDIGGFTGETTPELYARWLQLAVFHPLMRTHSIGTHLTGDAIYNEEPPLEPEVKPEGEEYEFGQEPWSYGDKWTAITRTAIELRYCLLPVMYTAFWRQRDAGIPVLRSAAFADEQDPKLLDQDRDFLFADHLWISPVIASGVRRQMVYLPQGNWYYFWTGQLYQGEVFVTVTEDQIPFFIREGAVMPAYPIRQHTAEPVEELTLYCYHKLGKEVSYLYEDAGEGMEYLAGEQAIYRFEMKGDSNSYLLKCNKEGSWTPEFRKVKLYLIGFPTFVKKCEVDGVEMPIKEIRLKEKSLYTLHIPFEFKEIAWHG